MPFEVELLQPAFDDLNEVADWLVEVADIDTAKAYIDRIQARCLELARFPRRGTPRHEFGVGIRSIPFERRATIFYRIHDHKVQVIRIVRAGRDLARISTAP